MQLSDFHFDLPDELIARFPTKNRSDSRLLHLDDSGNITDRQFTDLLDQLRPEDCLVFNNTKVMPARLLGKRDSGGAVELLIERVINERQFLTQIKSSNKLKPGAVIHIGEYQVSVVGRESMFYLVELVTAPESNPSSDKVIWNLLDDEGHMPLPPYIDRPDGELDLERYQTVYAEHEGAVAAPTAGLHFSDELLERIREKGVSIAFVTLHVGSGTFSPVRADNILEHKMHSEWFEVPDDVVQKVTETQQQGGRVIAVGTTSVRCLETAAKSGEMKAMSGDTDIFIYPGYQFQCVDALITNFHLPESTLIMLVSAFSGQEQILRAYKHAVEQQYRFFSYGDAMLLERAAHIPA